jgi:hypothetical protein
MTINIYRSTHRDLSRGKATELDAETFQSETFWDRAIINTVFELWGFDLVRVTLETEGTEVVCLIASGWQPNDCSKGSRLKFQIHSGELDTLPNQVFVRHLCTIDLRQGDWTWRWSWNCCKSGTPTCCIHTTRLGELSSKVRIATKESRALLTKSDDHKDRYREAGRWNVPFDWMPRCNYDMQIQGIP